MECCDVINCIFVHSPKKLTLSIWKKWYYVSENCSGLLWEIILLPFLLFYSYLLFFRMASMILARLFWRLWSVWYHFWNENWLTHCHMLWPQHWLIFHRHWWKMLSMFFAGISFLLQSPMSTTQGFIDLSKVDSFAY